MSRKIDLDPVLKHITRKLFDDRQRLSRILESREQDGLRGFEDQERLLEHIQAGVRALDVLEGKASLEGDPLTPRDRAPVASLPVASPIDMDKLAEALRPNGAAH